MHRTQPEAQPARAIKNKKGWQRVPTLLNVISQPPSMKTCHESIFFKPISACLFFSVPLPIIHDDDHSDKENHANKEYRHTFHFMLPGN
jgi:hypothetical protein